MAPSTSAEKIALRVAERNSWPTYTPHPISSVFKMLREKGSDVMFERGIPTQEWLNENFPVQKLKWEVLRKPKSPNNIQSTWIGHATCFVQMGNLNILTDPIFSERCSGVQWAGPKRYRPPACTVKELMVDEKVGVDVVLISHNHYDHLDYNSVKELAKTAISVEKPISFIVPLGIKSWFRKKIPESFEGGSSVTELDWHVPHIVKGSTGGISVRITPVPMQHWSNRYGYDRDKTLWCGYAVTVVQESDERGSETNGANYLFTGDTGLFDAAAQIGERYGPFDLAAIPIGAYEPRWFMKQEHMNPEDAVRFMDLVRAKMATPIHWGTFALTTEPVLEPREKLAQEMKRAGKDVSTFPPSLLGETLICEC